MNYLDSLNILGNLINFTGTIFLSVGLLRSENQIKDEEATYWDANPYKTRNNIKSQPYYKWGFRLLLIGFSITIAFAVEKIIPDHDEEIVITALAMAFSSIGFVFIQSFENLKEKQHLSYKKSLLTDQFFDQMRRVLREVKDKSIKEPYKSNQEFFGDFKRKKISNFRERINEINENYQNRARELMSDLDTSLNFEQFASKIEDYLEELKD